MTKEEILERLKDSIITVAKKGDEFRGNDALFQKWLENKQKVTEAIEELNSCDLCWLNDTYSQWFKNDEFMQAELIKRRDILRAWSGVF